MKVPDIARFLKCKEARRQCHLLRSATQGMHLGAHGDQQVSGAGGVVRFALLALLSLGGWPQGFQQPQAATSFQEPAQHPVIHSTGHTRNSESTEGVFGVSRTQYKLSRFLALKLVCGLAEGTPIRCLGFFDELMFVLLPGCSWLWCG